MTDRQILQWAFNALSDGYEGARLHDVLAVLRDRLAEPEILPGQMIELTAAEVKILRRASLNDRQFAEMIQAKLRDKNS